MITALPLILIRQCHQRPRPRPNEINCPETASRKDLSPDLALLYFTFYSRIKDDHLFCLEPPLHRSRSKLKHTIMFMWAKFRSKKCREKFAQQSTRGIELPTYRLQTVYCDMWQCTVALTTCKLWEIERQVFHAIVTKTELMRQQHYALLLRRCLPLSGAFHAAQKSVFLLV